MVTATTSRYLYGTVDHPKIVVVKKQRCRREHARRRSVREGRAAVTWTYDVSAPDATLDHVSLIDDNGNAPVVSDDFHPLFVSGDRKCNGKLDPGEHWVYTATGIAPAGLFAKFALASGSPTTAPPPSTTTTSRTRSASWRRSTSSRPSMPSTAPTSIERSDGVWRELLVGTQAAFTYLVTNTGTSCWWPARGSAKHRHAARQHGRRLHRVVRLRRHEQRRNDLTETWLFQAAPADVRVGAYVNTTTVSGFEPTPRKTPTSADQATSVTRRRRA